MTVHDVVCVGAGPFNLGLAALAEPTGLDVVVLEQRDDVGWHSGMLLPEATLQVPFLADLVTLADPTSPYSFLAFLKETGRLYPFYVRERVDPLRVEYDRYLRWAADGLGVRTAHRVERIERDPRTGDHVGTSTTAFDVKLVIRPVLGTLPLNTKGVLVSIAFKMRLKYS